MQNFSDRMREIERVSIHPSIHQKWKLNKDERRDLDNNNGKENRAKRIEIKVCVRAVIT